MFWGFLENRKGLEKSESGLENLGIKGFIAR